MENSIKNEILGFIEETFDVDRNNIKDDESLMSLGSVYSVGIISMIKFIEDTFNMIVEDDDISMDNFGSVSKIVRYIETHR